MNLLVVGFSHHTAPAALLERIAIPLAGSAALLNALLGQSGVGEAVILSTCNRVEVYAGVSGPEALADITAVLAERTGVDTDTLAAHRYVRYEAEAVRHTCRVAAGLDSMVVGEAQILGQLRDAYALADECGAVGRTMHQLIQLALRVGKRVHSETDIDAAGRSMVTAALDLGLARTGISIDTAAVLVVGAGAMGALALATLRRAGARELMVTNRSFARACRLAANYDATAVPMSSGYEVLRHVDVVVCATSSTTRVLTAADLPPSRTRPLLVLDLAVPRDVDPAVTDVPGVTLVDIAALSDGLARTTGTEAAVTAAEAIVAKEVAAFVSRLRGFDIAPTVAALRTRADDVVGAELAALRRRCPDLSEHQRAQIARTVRRTAQRLLHEPTVRARELAASPGGDRYAALVRDLFDLGPGGPVSQPVLTEAGGPGPAR